MPTVDGIPVPGRSDAADAPAQLLSMAEALDLRIDSIDGQDDADITALATRVTALETSLSALQVSATATQADLDALEAKYANLLSWTKIGTTRIEVRTIVRATDARGFVLISFAQPFKKTPLTVLTSGSGFGMSAANGSDWNSPAAPGPYLHDNTYGGWIYTNGPTGSTCGGFKANTMVRINYISVGEAAFTDRAANLGGPGWDII